MTKENEIEIGDVVKVCISTEQERKHQNKFFSNSKFRFVVIGKKDSSIIVVPCQYEYSKKHFFCQLMV